MSRAEHWFRWHHGTAFDPKWRVVAARASHAMSREVTPCHVLAVWAAMLECASQSSPRGLLANWCDEDVAAGLGVEPAVVEAIRNAMQGKTLEGTKLSAWEERQPKAEDSTAAKRKAEQRERKKSRDVTSSHVESRSVTTETETETEEDQKHVAGKPALPACPHKEILQIYHDKLPVLPAVKVWDEDRAKALRSRWREDPKRQSLAWWEKYFGYVAERGFLTGSEPARNGGRPFVANLDWLLNKKNMIKVIEGNYE